MNVDRVADAHAKEGARHLSVECPVAKRGAFGQPPFDFDGKQIDAHRLRVAFCDRRRQVGRFARNIRLDQSLRRRQRRDDELSFHAGLAMARHAAEVDEIPGLGGAECNRRARALAGDARRARILIGQHDIVLGAFAIDEGELHDLSFGGGQHRVDLAVDRAAHAEIDHAALGDARAQGVTRIGDVADSRRRRALRRIRGGAAGAGVAARLRLRHCCCRRGQIGDDVGAIVVGLQAQGTAFCFRAPVFADRPNKRRASWHPK